MSDEYSNKLTDDIVKYGFGVIMVPQTNYLPSFAYTVGLWKSYKHPELISLGLPIDTLHTMLNTVVFEIIKKEKLIEYSKIIGTAFQIKDDLFDYFSKNIVGKPVGIDIKEQKMTLPLIYSLKTASEKDRKYYFNIIKNHNKNPKRVKELIDFVKKSGGLDYAKKIMENYQQEDGSIKVPDVLVPYMGGITVIK